MFELQQIQGHFSTQVVAVNYDGTYDLQLSDSWAVGQICVFKLAKSLWNHGFVLQKRLVGICFISESEISNLRGSHSDLSGQPYHRWTRPSQTTLCLLMMIVLLHGVASMARYGNKPDKHLQRTGSAEFAKTGDVLPQAAPNQAFCCQMARDKLRHFQCHKLAGDFAMVFRSANVLGIESFQVAYAPGQTSVILGELGVDSFRVAGSLLTRQIGVSALKT